MENKGPKSLTLASVLRNKKKVTTWVDLESIVSHILMRERQILYSFTYMWYLKARQNKQMNTAKTDSYKDQRDGC